MTKLIAALIAATFSLGAFAQTTAPALTAAPSATIQKAGGTSAKKAKAHKATKHAKQAKKAKAA